MPVSNDKLIEQIRARFGSVIKHAHVAFDEATIEVSAADVKAVCLALRDESGFGYDLLVDLCGVDYLDYAEGAWEGSRFAVVYHLLSVSNNSRLRIRVFLEEESLIVDSVVDVWTGANWFEREAFDLFGILFDGHPDLRRLLTDYGFIGHPFRKDFPLVGHVEMRYDPERKRVIYEPVTIEERINIPRIIRYDNRYEGATEE